MILSFTHSQQFALIISFRWLIVLVSVIPAAGCPKVTNRNAGHIAATNQSEAESGGGRELMRRNENILRERSPRSRHVTVRSIDRYALLDRLNRFALTQQLAVAIEIDPYFKQRNGISFGDATLGASYLRRYLLIIFDDDSTSPPWGGEGCYSVSKTLCQQSFIDYSSL